MANLGLKRVGAATGYSRSTLCSDLDFMDTFYLGDGWSADGSKEDGVRQLDYYSSSFALQYAPLLYAKLEERVDPERCERYRECARLFARCVATLRVLLSGMTMHCACSPTLSPLARTKETSQCISTPKAARSPLVVA